MDAFFDGPERKAILNVIRKHTNKRVEGFIVTDKGLWYPEDHKAELYCTMTIYQLGKLRGKLEELKTEG